MCLARLLRLTLLSAFIGAAGVEVCHGKGETLELASEEEATAWDRVAARFTEGPEFRRDREKRITAARMKASRTDPQGKGWVEIQIDPETHQVRKLSSDAAFTNEQIAELAAFSALEVLTLWHNSPPTKEHEVRQYNGSGLIALKDLKGLREVTMAGGSFDDEGMAAAATLQHLEYLGVWNTLVTDVGLAALRDHPRLERIRLGANWRQRITDAGMVALAEVPHLKVIVIGETWLTYQGLASFIPINGELKKLDLGNTLILPADVDRLRKEMPETRIQWKGLAATGKILAANESARSSLTQWAPQKLVAQALQAANLVGSAAKPSP